MHNYTATIRWKRSGEDKFTDNRYSRRHSWEFAGGETIPASASPHVVPAPFSDPSAVDPEEAFVASIASCHMLWFLSLAAKRDLLIEEYRDQAEGVMEKNSVGKLAITSVILSPRVLYADGSATSPEENLQLHREAHSRCFIANSVKTEIILKPTMK